jgi:hypothetical protein
MPFAYLSGTVNIKDHCFVYCSQYLVGAVSCFKHDLCCCGEYFRILLLSSAGCSVTGFIVDSTEVVIRNLIRSYKPKFDIKLV